MKRSQIDHILADAVAFFDGLADARLAFETGGFGRELGPGDAGCLTPGESITFVSGTRHAFWCEGGDVFAEPVAWFPTIAEDAPPRCRLVGEHGVAA